MREILFKAKRTENGEWVEGNLIQSNYMRCVRSWISSPNDKSRLRTIATNYCDWRAVEVDTDTICQYTGLTDKNGCKIWEGDVVRCMDTIGKVGWNETHLAYTILADMKGNMQYFYLDESLSNCTEVIGNIFDNADLLGE